MNKWFLTFIVLGLLVFPSSVFALTNIDDSAPPLLVNVGPPAELDDTVNIGNPLNPKFGTGDTEKEADIISYFQGRLGTLLNTMFGILAVLSLVPIVIGGAHLIMSEGSSEKVKKGQQSLYWGIIGLVIAFSGIAFFNFLLRFLLPEK